MTEQRLEIAHLEYMTRYSPSFRLASGLLAVKSEPWVEKAMLEQVRVVAGVIYL